MSETMKAVRLHAFGGPEVLIYEDAPKPGLKVGEVLVRLHAIGLNPPDWNLRDGYKTLPPEWRPQVSFPLILGTDISGVVEAGADDVFGFSVGDEVYSMVRFPAGVAGDSKAYAEYVSVPASEVALKPAGIDHAHAAGAPISLLTAWQFLVELGHNEPNPLQSEQHEPLPLEGKTVLVNAAAGGVGHLALQIAKLKGAHVIAVASDKGSGKMLVRRSASGAADGRHIPKERYSQSDCALLGPEPLRAPDPTLSSAKSASGRRQVFDKRAISETQTSA